MMFQDIPAPATDVDEGILVDDEWLVEQPRSRFNKVNKEISDGYSGTFTEERWQDDPKGEFVRSCPARDGKRETHYPVFDIDHDLFHWRESATPGHYHLFFDKPIEWKKYEKVLDAMADAGMVDPIWVNITKRRRNGVVRVTWPHDYAEKKERQRYAEWRARERSASSWY